MILDYFALSMLQCIYYVYVTRACELLIISILGYTQFEVYISAYYRHNAFFSFSIIILRFFSYAAYVRTESFAHMAQFPVKWIQGFYAANFSHCLVREQEKDEKSILNQMTCKNVMLISIQYSYRERDINIISM